MQCHNSFQTLKYFSHLAPKKKRSKVTDTVRGPRSSLQQHHHRDNNSSYSLPASERSSPQVSASAYFPPTMVQQPSQLHQFNHHHHNHPAMLRPGGDSPRNSDEQSDYGGNEVSDKLTNIHLRKAKLSKRISFFLQQCCPERVFNSELTELELQFSSLFVILRQHC